jgi:hypothetical protein
MGRTVPSFRNVLEMEKHEWKPFRNAVDKSERNSFDEMWDIPKLYLAACSNSVQLVPLHPIIISIVFHHYKELVECSKQIEQMSNNNNRISSRAMVKNIKEEEDDDCTISHIRRKEERRL